MPLTSRKVEVGKVFTTSPRIGDSRGSLWITRTGIEREIGEALSNPGVHICIDGPSGTGKTSLALTMLSRKGIRYLQVQITDSMTWHDLCCILAQPVSNATSSLKVSLTKIEYTRGSRPSEDLDYFHKLTGAWIEHDIGRMLADEDITLLIDDFEQASPALVKRVSDLAKLLTQSYQSPNARLVIVGADDVCRRLFDANPRLDGRLNQTSVGTLANQGESWRFLTEGFSKLGLRHPGTSSFPAQRAQVPDCMAAIYKAADGLPKSLNELGRSIAQRCNGRHVNASDIFEFCDAKFAEGLKQCKRRFPLIIKCLRENPLVRVALSYLFENGIGSIHSWSDMQLTLGHDYSEDQVEAAIESLISVGFLVRTGQLGDVLFTAEPRFAHILGVVVSDPANFCNEPLVKRFNHQLTLPMNR